MPAVAEPLKVGSAYPDVPAARPGSYLDENQCIWARVKWRDLQVDANSGTSGFDEDAVGVSGGGQFAFNGPWFGAITFGYENSDITGSSVRSDGDRFQVGGTLKYISGPWLVAGAITGGWSDYDSSRSISFPGFASVATSDQEFSDIGGHLRVAYQTLHGPWYLKPMVDLNVVNVDMDGFTEKGGNGAALTVAGSDETVFSATPAVEIGNQWALKSGALVRPYLRGGVSFYSDADFPMSARFAAASGVAPFRTTGEIDDVVGNIGAGVQYIGLNGGVLSFAYDGHFGEDLEENSVSARASWPLWWGRR
jgi:outer membrane autotransporter protein